MAARAIGRPSVVVSRPCKGCITGVTGLARSSPRERGSPNRIMHNLYSGRFRRKNPGIGVSARASMASLTPTRRSRARVVVEGTQESVVIGVACLAIGAEIQPAHAHYGVTWISVSASRPGPLMTHGTIRSSIGVVPACRQPGTAAVAAVAGCPGYRRNRVIARHALDDAPVVAVGALAGHGDAVVVACAEEGGSIVVAGLAGRIGDDVLERLGCRDDAFARGVATVAGARCADEHTADVAGFTACRGVHPCQREARGHMVEFAILRLGRGLPLQ